MQTETKKPEIPEFSVTVYVSLILTAFLAISPEPLVRHCFFFDWLIGSKIDENPLFCCVGLNVTNLKLDL